MATFREGKFMKKFAMALLLLLCTLPAAAQSRSEMTGAEIKRLDTFFSNFSETALPSFKAGQLADAVLLVFALQPATKNNLKAVRHAGDWAYVPAALVDQVTEKYFGIKIRKQAQAEYKLPEASGEAYTFSQIAKLTPSGDLFIAEGLIYTASSGFDGDTHADPSVWKKAGEEVNCYWTFTATIRRQGDRYILVDYQKQDR